MLSFIIILLFGLAVSFFAGQNTLPVTIHLSNYQLTSVPLYVVIVVSMLVGFIISWLVSLVETLFNVFVIRGKDSAIKESQIKVDKLHDKIHELEVENAKLKGENKEKEPVIVEHTQEDEPRLQPSILDRFRHAIR